VAGLTVRYGATVTSAPAAAPARTGVSVRTLLGWMAVFLLVAALTWFGKGFADSGRRHSWDDAAVPSATVGLTAGRTYTLSTRGGIAGLAAVQSTDQPALTCTATQRNGASTELQLTVESVDSRTLHVIGRFRSPVTGRVGVSCEQVGGVFVDNADDARVDRTVGLTVLTAVALVGAVWTGCSAGYELARDAPV
jgi:hypothetical protein